MRSPRRGFKRAFTAFINIFRDWELRSMMLFGAAIIAVGVVFYMVVEGWDIVEALYFCVATLTTVGYGDLHPTNDLSRLFTTGYLLVGIGFILGFVNVVAHKATQPIITRMNQRNDRDIND